MRFSPGNEKRKAITHLSFLLALLQIFFSVRNTDTDQLWNKPVLGVQVKNLRKYYLPLQHQKKKKKKKNQQHKT